MSSELAWRIRYEILDENPLTAERVQEAIRQGMIPRSELRHEAWYIGTCRNAKLAMWRADEGRFFYLRTKFGHTYAEAIHHPEDDNGFDFFVPTGRILPDGVPGLLEEAELEAPKSAARKRIWNMRQPRTRPERMLWTILELYGIDDIEQNPTARRWAEQILIGLKELENWAKSRVHDHDIDTHRVKD